MTLKDWRRWVARIMSISIFVLVLAGCVAAPAGTPVAESIRVWHDDDHGVTCWVYKDGYGGGISCLPDREVNP